ncbi:hypothetical protein MSAN_02345600 [Mycena sanguinolenta]|uniref:Uncharacterized protein n=1 Tax=Mycena sanguinolenta TaxID=230812 RepID=A0A8H6X6K8_9AGAR|nr:hypothetical protein MSAN_02345600 [Mycena sanguinolenta]
MSQADRYVLQQRLLDGFRGITQTMAEMRDGLTEATLTESPGTVQFATDIQNEMDSWETILPKRVPRAPPPRSPPVPSNSTNDNTPNPDSNNGSKAKKPRSKGPPKLTAEEKEEEAIRTRLAAIHAEAAKPPITMDEHKEYLNERSSETGPGTMDRALGRAFRGYEFVGKDQQESCELWQKDFTDYFERSTESIAAVVARSEPPPADPEDRYTWLVGVENDIALQKKRARTDNTIDLAYIALTSIEFAMAWNRQNAPQKNDAFTALFVDQPHHKQRFQGLNLEQASKIVKKEFGTEFEKWKTNYRRLELTPRSKLAEVYMNVRFFFFEPIYAAR